ncbi:RNA polymerase I termination factor [Amaranthus tricolor]|uniref:RNA polymerase I termination factor n=1 Tax=Amaranthus tricolor TaxID=29722 RepID=UPI002590DD44|nr:RNA polymerase I termination factor [Amaranthus tricolor]XP_057536579.1 RNA polymerase I termination factor [Amaranthus tricolor]
MTMSNEGDAFISVKKKHKKLKNSKINSTGVEDDIQIVDEGHSKKKSKTKAVSNISNLVSDVEIGVHVDKSCKKEKKKKDKSRTDVSAQGNDEKIEGKIKKSKIGEMGRASNFLKHAGGNEESLNLGVNDLGSSRKKKKHSSKNDTGNLEDKGKFVTDVDVELLKGNELHAREDEHLKMKKKKKKKKKIEHKDGKSSNDNARDSSGGDYNDTCIKRKKKSVDSSMKGGVNASALETRDADFVEHHISDEIIRNAPNVKDKKIKKKNKDDSYEHNSEKSGDRSSSKKKKKKKHSIGSNTVEDLHAAALENNENSRTVEPFENSNSSKKSRRVKFSDTVEVFPLPDNSSKGKKRKREDDIEEKKVADDGLVRGKRFSKEEDKMVQDAVYKYIDDHNLGEQGLEMVMKCKSYPKLKDCWKEIGQALPHRPYVSVYCRAHILFERSDTREWTPEEIELVLKAYEKLGSNWKKISLELGKNRIHVKDAWRRYKHPDLKSGKWSQEEYQNLFNLVNMDLAMKAYTEKKTKYGMLRDNISWGAISDRISTRSNALCCMKWYRQLRSPMVDDGLWSDVDDYRMLIALADLDAFCEEDVDWDNLLEHRSGDICRRRWSQMVRHIGEFGTKPFNEQVEILSQRYCPNLLEAREAYENKVPVD